MFIHLTNTSDEMIQLVIVNISYIKPNSKGGSSITCNSGIIDVLETEAQIAAVTKPLKVPR